MQQPYGAYPYGSQQAYPQTPHIGAGPGTGYPSYYPPAQTTPFIPPAPTPFNPSANQTLQPAAAPMPRPKRHRTNKAPSTPFPLKSALKNPTSTDPRSNPIPMKNPEKRRTHSNAEAFNPHPQDFIPIHLFLSFHGSNTFRIENILDIAVNELKETILPMWPYGVESTDRHGYTWQVKFSNSPWNSYGSDAIIAWQIIVALFTLFARRGFTYGTSMNTANPPPRLVFIASDTDDSSHFFLGYFSRNGRRLTLVNPPPHIDTTIGPKLKAALPRRIGSDRVVDDAMRVIDLKETGFGATEVESSFFLAHVLKVIDELGYSLEATVPMARRGLFGLGSRRELLVFKGRRH